MPLVKQSDGSFELTVPLPKEDNILYKYVVDGEWVVNNDQAVETDASGIENNVLSASQLSVLSEGTRIPEAGGLAAGSGTVNATVLPTSEGKQTTLGEPGIFIPKDAEALSAFETVRDVDPKTLNEPAESTPELTPEEKKKQKKKLKKTQYKLNKKKKKAAAAAGAEEESTTEADATPEPTAAPATAVPAESSETVEAPATEPESTQAADAIPVVVQSTIVEQTTVVAEVPVNEAPAAERVAVAEETQDLKEPAFAESVTAEPAVAESVAAEPTVAESVAAEPTVAEPLVAEPVVAEPAVAEPAVAEPLVAEPLVAEPVFAEPVVAEPLVEKAAVEEPALEEPVAEEAAVVVPEDTETKEVDASPVAKNFDIDTDEIIIAQGGSSKEAKEQLRAANGGAPVEELQPTKSEALKLTQEGEIQEATTAIEAAAKSTRREALNEAKEAEGSANSKGPAKAKKTEKKKGFFSKLKKIFK